VKGAIYDETAGKNSLSAGLSGVLASVIRKWYICLTRTLEACESVIL